MSDIKIKSEVQKLIESFNLTHVKAFADVMVVVNVALSESRFNKEATIRDAKRMIQLLRGQNKATGAWEGAIMREEKAIEEILEVQLMTYQLWEMLEPKKEK